MNKKAQFYIITAIILLALTFGFFKPKIKYETDRTFMALCDNYIREASFAANTGNLGDFTQKFVEFGNTREPDFGIAYLYVQSQNITAANLLKKTIYINENKVMHNETVVIDRENKTVITTDSSQYTFNTSEYPKISAFVFSESENNKRVCLKNA